MTEILSGNWVLGSSCMLFFEAVNGRRMGRGCQLMAWQVMESLTNRLASVGVVRRDPSK